MAEKELVDLSEITIDHTLDKVDRIKKYIADIGDPYHFRVGEIKVKISFESDGCTMQEKMQKYFESMMM